MKDFASITALGSVIPGPIGMISAGVSAAAYTKAGDRKQATMMTASIVAAGVGGGLAIGGVKAFQAVKGAGGVKAVANTG